jgi:retinol dehydrogenase 14
MQNLINLKDKTILITGSTSGIGEAATKSLAKTGANLVLIARNEKKVLNLIDVLKSSNNNNQIDYLICDLSNQKQIHRIAGEFKEKHNCLDILINNAGGLFYERKLTEEGYEYTFALDHLSYFLLSNLFLDIIKLSTPSRIINVSSATHFNTHIDFNNLMGEKFYSPQTAYAQAKLANVMFTYALARRLNDTGVTVNCLHPGIVRTNFGSDESRPGNMYKYPFGLSPEEGADTIVYLATSPEVEKISGYYFEKRKKVKSSDQSYDKEIVNKLWQVSEKMVQYKVPC